MAIDDALIFPDKDSDPEGYDAAFKKASSVPLPKLEKMLTATNMLLAPPAIENADRSSKQPSIGQLLSSTYILADILHKRCLNAFAKQDTTAPPHKQAVEFYLNAALSAKQLIALQSKDLLYPHLQKAIDWMDHLEKTYASSGQDAASQASLKHKERFPEEWIITPPQKEY